MNLASLSPNRSLMARLVGSFLTVSLLTVGFVAIVAFSEARSALREAVIERLQASAAERETQLNRWVERRRENLVFLCEPLRAADGCGQGPHDERPGIERASAPRGAASRRF